MGQNTNKYEDMLKLPHPNSKKHPRMSRENRAAQFSPFAALTGYDAAVMETARLTQAKRQLDEQQKEHLDKQIKALMEAKVESLIEVEHYVPDPYKEGGAYRISQGYLKKIDGYENILLLKNGQHIFLDDIYELTVIE